MADGGAFRPGWVAGCAPGYARGIRGGSAAGKLNGVAGADGRGSGGGRAGFDARATRVRQGSAAGSRGGAGRVVRGLGREERGCVVRGGAAGLGDWEGAGLPEAEECFQAVEEAGQDGGDEGLQGGGQHSPASPRRGRLLGGVPGAGGGLFR